MKMKALLAPALALFLISLVSSFLLAGTNAITKDRIDEALREQESASRLVAFSDAASFGEEGTCEANGRTVDFTPALDGDGNVIGYVFTSSAHGYAGEVNVMTGVTLDGAVKRVVILSMDNETPGLGQNAGKEEFWGQFTGREGPFYLVKSGGEGSPVTSVTSASYTSGAVVDCVNDALAAFENVKGQNQ